MRGEDKSESGLDGTKILIDRQRGDRMSVFIFLLFVTSRSLA